MQIQSSSPDATRNTKMETKIWVLKKICLHTYIIRLAWSESDTKFEFRARFQTPCFEVLDVST